MEEAESHRIESNKGILLKFKGRKDKGEAGSTGHGDT